MPEQQMSEEEIKKMQEKIKNMSPEELKEFQKKQCIFCHIVSGKVQSKKIYEDEGCVALLDINPANPGHILLLPKEHYSIMPQLPEEEIAHLFTVAKTISNAALRALEVQGTNIVVQNGIAAGQKAQHFMIHIIPRKEKDGINFELPQKEIPEDELEKIREQLEKKLGAVKGTRKEKSLPKIKEQIKKRIVEAEFEEDRESKAKAIPKLLNPKDSKGLENSKNFQSKTKKSAGKKSKRAKEEISLDDISKIIGAE